MVLIIKKLSNKRLCVSIKSKIASQVIYFTKINRKINFSNTSTLANISS